MASEANRNNGLPTPNCTEETGTGAIEFGRVGRRVVQGRFDGGSLTSNGGGMLIGTIARKLGLPEAAARCIATAGRFIRPWQAACDVPDLRAAIPAFIHITDGKLHRRRQLARQQRLVDPQAGGGLQYQVGRRQGSMWVIRFSTRWRCSTRWRAMTAMS